MQVVLMTCQVSWGHQQEDRRQFILRVAAFILHLGIERLSSWRPMSHYSSIIHQWCYNYHHLPLTSNFSHIQHIMNAHAHWQIQLVSHSFYLLDHLTCARLVLHQSLSPLEHLVAQNHNPQVATVFYADHCCFLFSVELAQGTSWLDAAQSVSAQLDSDHLTLESWYQQVFWGGSHNSVYSL